MNVSSGAQDWVRNFDLHSFICGVEPRKAKGLGKSSSTKTGGSTTIPKSAYTAKLTAGITEKPSARGAQNQTSKGNQKQTTKTTHKPTTTSSRGKFHLKNHSISDILDLQDGIHSDHPLWFVIPSVYSSTVKICDSALGLSGFVSFF